VPKISTKFHRGYPLRGRQIQVEWVKIGNFRQITGYISNTVEDGHIHPFNGPLSGTTQVSRYQKGKTNLDFTEARDSEWQWHQLGHMQVCTSLQTDNHTSTSCFLQAGCPSFRPTNSVKALKRDAWFLLKSNRNSYALYRMVALPMTMSAP